MKLSHVGLVALGLIGAGSIGSALVDIPKSLSLEEVAQGIVVVSVKSKFTDEMGKEQVGNGFGTGFFIEDNIIVTNDHVIDGAVGDILVSTNGSAHAYKAKLISTDRVSDLAIIELIDIADFKKYETHTVLRVRPSDGLRVGDRVFTVGHPSGFFYTFSDGIVSFVKRRRDTVDPGPNYYIQTDANIYEGNSGGPLIDTSGAVIGINELLYQTNGGSIGLSISSDILIRALGELKAKKTVEWSLLGIEMKWNRDYHGIEIVNEPVKSGLAKGDWIKTITVPGRNRVDVKVVEDLQNEITMSYPGDVVTFDVMRKGRAVTVTSVTKEANWPAPPRS